MVEHHIVFEHFSDEKCFSYSSSAVNGNKFCLIRVKASLQLLYFLLSSYDSFHISISLFRRKDTKNIVSGKIRRSYFARIDIKYALAAR